MLRDGPASVGVFSSEGGQFVGGHAMSEENKLKTAAGFSSLWDGTPVKRVRQGDGISVLHGRRVACHLQMQPAIGAKLFSDPTLNDQGFISRLLPVYPDSTSGTRFWREPDPASFSRISNFSRRISEILKAERSIGDRKNELRPRVIPLSATARRLWIDFADSLEGQIGEDGSLRVVHRFAGKAAEHAARLATIIALFCDLNVSEVSQDYMAAGIVLARHYIAESLRIHAAGLDDPDLLLAEKLNNWLHREWSKSEPTGLVSLPAIYQFGPAAIRDKRTAERIMTILDDHGYVEKIEGPQLVGGVMRREVWMVLPEVSV